MHTHNILICGTGAIGGYFGGRMALNKNLNVHFLSKGKIFNILKTQGLQVNSINGDFHIKINVHDTLAGIKEHFDYIFICVKSGDTENLFHELDNVISPRTLIITLQNGIYNFRILSKRYGEDRVLQGICKIGVEMNEGIVYHTSLGMLVMGEISGIISQRLAELEQMFRESNIKMKITKNINREIWVKFGWNAIFNTISAIYNIRTDEIFSSPELNALMMKLYEEFKLIAASQGVPFADEEYKKIILDTKSLSGFKTSALQDKQKGKPTEIKYFIKEITDIAEAKNIQISYFKQIIQKS